MPPPWAEVFVEELHDRTGHPRGEMHTVGDMPNRNVLLFTARPQVLPHAAADGTMQFGHCVDAFAALDGHHRHAIALMLAARINLAHRLEFLRAEFEIMPQHRQVVFQDFRRETVMPRLHRRVRGEQAAL